MFMDGKTKFRTTRSVQLATTRNYMEKRRLGQTVLQYQKECKEIMKQLRDRQYSFLKAKYPHIVAMNSLQMMGKSNPQAKRSRRETGLCSIPATYVKKDMNTTSSRRDVKRTVKQQPNETENIYKRQKGTISLPSLTRRDIKHRENLEIKYVTRRLPPLDELHT